MSSTPDHGPSEDHDQQDISKIREKVDTADIECPICLQKCLHPVKLPCNHVFCYLCCKGEGIKRKRCAMCRSEIPPTYFFEPELLEKEKSKEFILDDGYQWFYEGRNGWWQYDERSSLEIEECFITGVSSSEILIAGHLYNIDFKAMRQHRNNQPGRFRKIKRDLCTFPKKGVAGLKINSTLNVASSRDEGDGNVNETEASRPNSSASANAIQTENEGTDSGAVGNIPVPSDTILDSTPIAVRELSRETCPSRVHYESTAHVVITPNSVHSTRPRTRRSPVLENETVENVQHSVQQSSEISDNTHDIATRVYIREKSGYNCNLENSDTSSSPEQRSCRINSSVSNRVLNSNITTEDQSGHSNRSRHNGRNVSDEPNITSSLANLSLYNATDISPEAVRGVRRRPRTNMRSNSPS